MRVNQEARTASAEKRREKTRQGLVDAAIRVISRAEAGVVTIDAITAEAGVAKGTFYNHFDGLDAMTDEIGDRISERLKYVMLEAQAAFGDQPARMIAYGSRIFVEGVMIDPVIGWLVVRVGTGAEGVARHHRENFLGNFELGVAQGLFQPAQPQAAIDMVFGALIFATRSILEGRTQPEHSKVITELILRGLGLEAKEARRLAWAELAELAPPGGPRSRPTQRF